MTLVVNAIAAGGLGVCVWLAVQALRSEPARCQGCDRCREHAA